MATRLKLAGGAVASAVVFLFVSGCGQSGENTPVEGAHAARYDAGTESALRGIINPSMKRAARRITSLALRHPGLATTTVGRNQIDVTISNTGTRPSPDGSPETDRARLEVITGRLPSGGPDLNDVLSVSTYRSASVEDDSDRDFSEGVNLYAPGGSFLGAGLGNRHIKGWSAMEIMSTGTEPAGRVIHDTSGPASKLVDHDPLATADTVTAATGPMIDYTSFDLVHTPGE